MLVRPYSVRFRLACGIRRVVQALAVRAGRGQRAWSRQRTLWVPEVHQARLPRLADLLLQFLGLTIVFVARSVYLLEDALEWLFVAAVLPIELRALVGQAWEFA